MARVLIGEYGRDLQCNVSVDNQWNIIGIVHYNDRAPLHLTTSEALAVIPGTIGDERCTEAGCSSCDQDQANWLLTVE